MSVYSALFCFGDALIVFASDRALPPYSRRYSMWAEFAGAVSPLSARWSAIFIASATFCFYPELITVSRTGVQKYSRSKVSAVPEPFSWCRWDWKMPEVHSPFWSLKLVKMVTEKPAVCCTSDMQPIWFCSGSWHDYCGANYESGRKGVESKWGRKKIKIEKGNHVRQNDGSLWERQVNNSSLQADRFAVPATIATIYITHTVSWRK